MAKAILGLVAFALVLAIPGEEALARRKPRKRRPKEPIIVHRLLNLEGTALLDGVPAPEFAPLKQNQTIETKEDGRLIGRIAGLGLFQLGGNSQVRLNQFGNRDRFRMEVLKGDALISIRRPGEHQIAIGGKILRITDDATVRIKVSSPQEPEVCACRGKFDLEPRAQADRATTKPAAAKLTEAALPTTGAEASAPKLPISPELAAAPGASPEPPLAAQEPVQACCHGIDLEKLDSLYKLP